MTMCTIWLTIYILEFFMNILLCILTKWPLDICSDWKEIKKTMHTYKMAIHLDPGPQPNETFLRITGQVEFCLASLCRSHKTGATTNKSRRHFHTRYTTSPTPIKRENLHPGRSRSISTVLFKLLLPLIFYVTFNHLFWTKY
jgi:hypothetical protein